ncbi:MAG: hypothetical protein AWU54_1415 [Candidatus Frackibacter sp. T328-2]|jgi:hypothetical protein|nr:MAG: hypothetical protein AWU54_1415 [Candidatus Frackibacter sp. T328-2]
MYYVLLGLFLYAFVILIVTNKSKLLSEILGITILIFITIMIGLRYGVGKDYFSYKAVFNLRYNEFVYEPIYSFLMYFIKIQFDKFHYLTFIMILFSNMFLYCGLKKRKIERNYLILSIFIYSSNMALVFMNLIRQSVSVSIFFYASKFIEERKFIKYLICIIIGAGFHSSILLLLPLYFTKDIRISKYKFFILIIFSYILVYTKLSQTILNFIAYRVPMFSKYYNHSYIFNENINILSFGVLLNVIFIFILYYFTNEDKNNLDVNYYLIGIIINVLAISSFMFDRIGIYFFIFGISAIPKMIQSIEKKELRFIFFNIALIVALVFFTQSLFLNPQELMLDYKSIFSK